MEDSHPTDTHHAVTFDFPTDWLHDTLGRPQSTENLVPMSFRAKIKVRSINIVLRGALGEHQCYYSRWVWTIYPKHLGVVSVAVQVQATPAIWLRSYPEDVSPEDAPGKFFAPSDTHPLAFWWETAIPQQDVEFD